MKTKAYLLFVTLCLLLGLAASAQATPESDFKEAEAAAKSGNMDKAIEDLTRFIDASASADVKTVANAYVLRGICYEAKKDTDHALADYTKAIELDPKSANALGNRAMLYAKLGEREKAKADATAARRIDFRVKVPKLD